MWRAYVQAGRAWMFTLDVLLWLLPEIVVD